MFTELIKDYLSFTRKERAGIIFLSVLIFFLFILPVLFPYLRGTQRLDHTGFEKEMAALREQQTDSTYTFSQKAEDGFIPFHPYQRKWKGEGNQYAGTMFYFDPNTATEAEWQQLGIRQKTILTISHFLEKGGHFRKAEDLSKIWGLHEDELKRLIPFIKIKSVPTEYAIPQKVYPRYEKRRYEPASVDINLGDSSAFIALPGIGEKLARRIIHFRDMLGGFYKKEQVGETFGLADSVFQKIRPFLLLNDPSIKQLNINTATIDELKLHPYIRFALARVIVEYRSRHGNFSSVTDLKKIMAITDEVFNKIQPYLKTN